MDVRLVVVGNELLSGDLSDTHVARIGGWLRAHGLGLGGACTVPDDVARIAEALAQSASESELLVVTGGLGPTTDDLTMEAASRWLASPLVEDAGALEHIRAIYRRTDRPWNEVGARQARIPALARALTNPAGTAPAVSVEVGRTQVFFLPGVPREVDCLLDAYIGPWLAGRDLSRRVPPHLFKTFGATESEVATQVEGLGLGDDLQVAYRATFPEIHVSLHLDAPDGPEARARLADLAETVRQRLGRRVFAEDPDITFAGAVAKVMESAQVTLAVAESCTGGRASSLITSVPGASAWFLEGLVTYSNDAKMCRLGVHEQLLRDHGAVSEPVARAMAEGARRTAGADCGLALTGIAGPSGGTEDKPVGTVHVALVTPDDHAHRALRLPFDRERNQLVSAYVALDLVRRKLRRTNT